MSKLTTAFLMMLVLPLAGGCRDVFYDKGSVCAYIDGEPGEYVLAVDANSEDCSGENYNTEFECEVTVEGDIVTVTTTLYTGRDRDSGCSSAASSCSVPIDVGEYTMQFASEEVLLMVPSTELNCLPPDTVP
jgi:hypothetical protein